MAGEEEIGQAAVAQRAYKRLGTGRSRGELRSDILYAVRETLRDGSYETFTIEQVAAKTSISRRTIYNLFQDKDDIYRQSCENLIKLVADLVVDEIPERMSSIDGIRFYITSCIDVFGNTAAQDLLRSVARDGAQHPWLVSSYYRHVREPLIRVCELFLLKKSRRTPLSIGAPRYIAVQVMDIVKSMTIAPLVFNYRDPVSEILPEQMDIIAQAYASLVEGKAGRG